MALPAAVLANDVWRPDVTVAVVVERDGRFLLVEERVRGALVVNQPAGHLEPGESLQDAAVREALEETGWRVALTRLVAVYLWPSPDDGLSYLRFTFAADAIAPVDGAQLDTGIERVLWLERGIAGDDTGGHIDDFARFTSPARIVPAEERRARDPNHRILESARERLEGARDARNRRIEVVRLPMPAPLSFDGQRLPASYANFYIANAYVLVPTFNDPADRLALGILSELFPERRVVGVHAVDLVLGLGTIHCSTQQEPL